MALEGIVKPGDLERALETGRPILAYVRGGEVQFWEPLEPAFTGEVSLHFRSGGLSQSRTTSTRHYRDEGEVNLREG